MVVSSIYKIIISPKLGEYTWERGGSFDSEINNDNIFLE